MSKYTPLEDSAMTLYGVKVIVEEVEWPRFEATKDALIYIYAWGERALTESEVQAELAWERFMEKMS